MKARYTNKDTWSGGFLELALELGERSDARLAQALEACWAYEGLEGCYLARGLEPAEQVAVPPLRLSEHPHLQGVATLTDGERVPCGTVSVREDDGPDWLDFYFPMGALAQTYDTVGGFPFGHEAQAHLWQKPLERWLTGLGKHIYAAVPYRLGLIGFEVSGMFYAAELTLDKLPEESWVRFLVPSEAGLAVY